MKVTTSIITHVEIPNDELQVLRRLADSVYESSPGDSDEEKLAVEVRKITRPGERS